MNRLAFMAPEETRRGLKVQAARLGTDMGRLGSAILEVALSELAADTQIGSRIRERVESLRDKGGDG